MDPITREILAANAFRTLGLSGSASQSVIEAAARRMRIWPDASRVPPTQWDLPSLGNLRRSKPDIEQAVALLNQPASRLEHRLFWFGGDRPPAEVSLLSLTDRHANAIVQLQSAWTQDNASAAQWSKVIDQISELSLSSELLDWTRDTEQAGQFDKRASPEEIASTIAEMPIAVAAGVVRRAIAALDQGDFDTVVAIATAIRKVPASPRRIHPADDLCDRIEDVFNAHCDQMEKDLRDNLRMNKNSPDGFYVSNYVHATRAAEFYDSKVLPTMTALMQLSTLDNDRLMRLKSRCGEVLILLALGWEWSGRFSASEQQLQEALNVSQGTVTELEVRRELDRIKPLARHERELTSAVKQAKTVALPGAMGSGNKIIQPSIRPPKPRKPKKKFFASGIGGLGYLAFILFRFIFASDWSSSSSSNSTDNQPVIPSFTFPTPRDLPQSDSSSPSYPELSRGRNDPFPNPGSLTLTPPLPTTRDFKNSVGDNFREP